MRNDDAVRATWALLLCLDVAGCGGSSTGGSSSLVTVTTQPTATPSVVPSVAPTGPAVDDWVTFAHDYLRTGYEQQSTGISKSNVGSLKLRWSTTLPDQIYSSPLVYGGLVIELGQNAGVVYALSTATGKIVWQTHLGGQLHSTGTIADGQLFVGTHDFEPKPDSAGVYVPVPSKLFDLDLTSGNVRWSITVNGGIRGTSVVAGGRVYYGVSGGDEPACFQGGVFAADEASGAPIWSWHVETSPNLGGAVWAPLTYDGTSLYFGTGNTCGPKISTANGFIALNAANGSLDWSLVAQPDSYSDDDTGAGAVLLGGVLYFISKDGNFYAVDHATGRLIATTTLNPNNYQGGLATATSDGTTILVGNGSLTPATAASLRDTKRFYSVRVKGSAAASGSELVALDQGFNVKWRASMHDPIASYAAINNGVVYAPFDASLTALDITSGAELWTYPTRQIIDGGAVVVPSGLYVADSGGTVYAFGLPATGTARKAW